MNNLIKELIIVLNRNKEITKLLKIQQKKMRKLFKDIYNSHPEIILPNLGEKGDDLWTLIIEEKHHFDRSINNYFLRLSAKTILKELSKEKPFSDYPFSDGKSEFNLNDLNFIDGWKAWLSGHILDGTQKNVERIFDLVRDERGKTIKTYYLTLSRYP